MEVEREELPPSASVGSQLNQLRHRLAAACGWRQFSRYGRFLEGINDYLNGPRRPEDLTPGYSGQNVMSTDRPLPGELGNPIMGPGSYPTYDEFSASNDPYYPGANIEPPDIPGNLINDTRQGGFEPMFDGTDYYGPPPPGFFDSSQGTNQDVGSDVFGPGGIYGDTPAFDDNTAPAQCHYKGRRI
jgi:hypothetical protein